MTRFSGCSAMASRPKAVELFAGIGGTGLGLEQAGFHVAAAVELEDITGRYAAYNLPATTVHYGKERGDVRQLRGSAYERLGIPRGDDLVLVAGGPPCQGFSIAGKKNAADPLNDLVLEFARVVLDLQPVAFLMENVPGIASRSDHLAEFVRRMTKHYRVAGPGVLCSADFGVPQIRNRVFVVGFRRDSGLVPSLPAPTHCRTPSGYQGELGLAAHTPTVWDAIHDLPNVDDYPELIDGDRVPYTNPPDSAYARVMRGHEIDPQDYSYRVAWDSTLCTNLRRTRHGPPLKERFAGLAFGQADKTSGIRRLHPHRLSTTIRAGTTRDRGSWSAPRPLHPYQDRVLTTRECARLQSFPDWFLFHPVKWHGNRQVGNAVPPLLARAIGRHLLRSLGFAILARNGCVLERSDLLVERDIAKARTSGLSRRKVSQQVVHPRLQGHRR